MTSEWLQHLVTDMACVKADMFSVTDSKIDVSHVCVFHEDSEVIKRNQAFFGFSRNNSFKTQRHGAGREVRWRHG